MTRAAIAAFCCAVLAAGCGSEAQEHSQAASTADAADTTPAKTDASAGPATTTHKARGKGTTVKVVGSQYGPVLADGRGQAFYLFASEKSGRSQCYGDCAHRWPPVLAQGTPRAGPGGSRAGSSERPDAPTAKFS